VTAANAAAYNEPEPVTVLGSPELNVKPKIRPLGDGATTIVTLPCGAQGTIRLCGDDVGSGWHYTVDGMFEFGRLREFHEISNAIEAFAHEKSRLRLAPLMVLAAAMRPLAIEAGPVDGFCKIVRRLLRERTGRDWSVTRGRGTAASWMTIHAPPKRRDPKFSSYMRIDDQILLSAALGYWVHGQGESVRPGHDVRGAYVFHAAGVPVPDDWTISEPGWD
jgi:hypothetical protein